MRNIWEFIRIPYNATHIGLFAAVLVLAVLGICDYWLLVWPILQWFLFGIVYLREGG